MPTAQPVLSVAPPRPARRSSPSSELLLVANAGASGLVRRRGLLEEAGRLLRLHGARVDARLTASVAELAEAVDRYPGRRVVLLGGDGTLHAAANLPGPLPEMALLPAGRANNVARSLGIPTELRAAVEVAVRGRVRPLDVIEATAADRRYTVVEGVSVGFLALARARYRSANSADLAAAAAAGLAALAGFRPVTVAIDSDGVAEVMCIGQLFVANLPLYGFGLRVAPGADPADGLLDLVALETAGRRSLPAMLARLRHGTHVGRRGVCLRRARRVRIATGGRSPVIADSTNLGCGTVELELVPKALRLVVPDR